VRIRLAVLVGAAALAVPAAASGAQISAGPAPVSYSNPNIEIDQGEQVSFLNLDLTAPHDVTSIDVGSGAKPLFASETVGFLTEVPVVGAEALAPGSYDYLCSIHTFMTGSITVRGAGSGGGAGPSLKLRALDRRLAKVERAGALRIETKLSKAATVTVVARAGKAKVAYAKKKLGKGTDSLKAKLTSKGERLVSKADRLALELSARATDASGNTTRRSVDITLR
jgi:plastocyanin